MAGISKKDMVINNIIAAMGQHLDAKLLRLLENVMRQNLYGLDVRAKRHLMDYLNERTDTDPALFVTDRRYNGAPKRMSKHGLESVTKAVGKRAGLNKNLTVHVFRRTFATRLADAGCPLEVIQELMGHVKPETTQRYIAKSQARVVQSAARYFNAA